MQPSRLVPRIDGRAGVDERLLEWLEPVHAHVHHVMGVPIELIDLLAEQGVPFDWTIHDYYTICPRVNLINGEHSYCGEPDEAGCNRCLARLGDDQGRPVATSIESWRDGFARRLRSCAARIRRQRR